MINKKNDTYKIKAMKIMNSVKNCNKNILKNRLFYKNISFLSTNNIDNKTYKFNSMSSSIIQCPNSNGEYIMCVRSVNYYLNDDATSVNPYNRSITCNDIIHLDENFNIKMRKTLNTPYSEIPYLGIEDARLFVFNSEIHFIGSSYDKESQKIKVVSNKYNLDDNILTPIFLTPTFNTPNRWEKNWVLFNNNGELNVIYKWYPLYICKINYELQELNLVQTNSTVPKFFSRFRGSTNGFEYDNKLWFIVHIRKQFNKIYYIYLHVFVCFDKNMSLISYSNPFNFENNVVEYCLGLVIKNNNFIITYSTLDRTTKLCVLSKTFVDKLMINYK